jgi:tetratricopeptide (TPR) repeat protein
MLAVRGRLAESEKRWRQFGVEQAQLGTAGPPLADSIALVQFDAWFRNQSQRAVARLDAAVSLHPLAAVPEQDRPYATLAQAYALAGRPDRARAILAQEAQMKDTALYRTSSGYVHQVLGEIALAEKRYADAIREFRLGDVRDDGLPVDKNPIRVHFNLGRAFDLASQPDSAIAHLEAYTTTRWGDRAEDDMYALAGVHKRLGELYEAKGDRERAISHLSTFVELWKNADAELQPAVADAKRRLMRLQANGKS